MSSTIGDHTDFEWQEIMAIDADIEPVVLSIQHLRDVFTTIQGLFLNRIMFDNIGNFQNPNILTDCNRRLILNIVKKTVKNGV